MNLVTLLPARPAMSDSELNTYLMDHGGRGREVLTYRKVKIRNPLTGELEPWARCTCSVCGAEWHSRVYGYSGSYPEFENHDGTRINGQQTTCPECGFPVEAAYYTRLKRHPIQNKRYVWEIVKAEGCIMFINWVLIYEIDDCGPALWPEKRNAYMLDASGKWHRFTAMERSGWSSMSAMIYTGEWYEMGKFSVADGNFRFTLPHDPAVYEGTALENAKLEPLEAAQPEIDRLLYARLYTRHQTIENLAMNSPELVAAALYNLTGPAGLDWMNWKAAKPHEILYMDKPDYKAAAALPWRDARKVVRKQRAVAACIKWGAPKDYADTLGDMGAEFAISPKHRFMKPWGLVHTWNYILKVAGAENPKMCTERRIESAISLCVDYWKDIQRANFDTGSGAVVFPKNLKNAHARAIQSIKYAESEALRAKFAKQSESLAPLRWECGGLFIVPAESEAQLIAEGKILKHCVGGYGKAHCDGRSIFFIRCADAADVPFFTLQLDTDTGRVLQNRGCENCDRTPEVRDFENRWLSEVVAPWLATKKKKTQPPQKATA